MSHRKGNLIILYKIFELNFLYLFFQIILSKFHNFSNFRHEENQRVKDFKVCKEISSWAVTTMPSHPESFCKEEEMTSSRSDLQHTISQKGDEDGEFMTELL